MTGNISVFIGQFVRETYMYTGQHFYGKLPEKQIWILTVKEFEGVKLTSP